MQVEFGKLLRAHREKLQRTQKSIAEELDYDNENFISMIESGKSNIPLKRLSDFVNLYRLTPLEEMTALKTYHPEVYEVVLRMVLRGRELKNMNQNEVDEAVNDELNKYAEDESVEYPKLDVFDDMVLFEDYKTPLFRLNGKVFVMTKPITIAVTGQTLSCKKDRFAARINRNKKVEKEYRQMNNADVASYGLSKRGRYSKVTFAEASTLLAEFDKFYPDDSCLIENKKATKANIASLVE